MCHCGYEKVSGNEDNGCCGCCCSCIKNACCCCCKCGACLFKFICSLLSVVGVFLIFYIIMMAVTDNYLANAVWRDRPFYYEDCEDETNCPIDDHGLVDGNYSTNVRQLEGIEGNRYGTQAMFYTYSGHGSNFLGAVYTDVGFENAKFKIDGLTDKVTDISFKMHQNIYLTEWMENKVLFDIEFTCTEDATKCMQAKPDFSNLKIRSIQALFWDFMPIGPGTSFGVASSNKFQSCDVHDVSGDEQQNLDVDYPCHD